MTRTTTNSKAFERAFEKHKPCIEDLRNLFGSIKDYHAANLEDWLLQENNSKFLISFYKAKFKEEAEKAQAKFKFMDGL